MRSPALIATVALVALSALPATAASRQGLAFDLRGKSWLNPGTTVRVGYGRDYATAPQFGGGPVNGVSSRGRDNLPTMPTGPLFTFPFLGANAR